MIKLNNKAAMFGLDARIALAIFGALSVITGAVLFSAIKTAKATAYLTKMTEMGKAWESYYVDTGVPLMVQSASYSHALYTRKLIEDPGLPGWKGPYLDSSYYKLLSYTPSTDVQIPRIDPNIAAYASLAFQNLNENWNLGHHYYRQCRTAGWKCGVWSVFNGFPNDSIFNEMDRIVDGGDGPFKGTARKKDNAIHLLIAPFPNPND